MSILTLEGTLESNDGRYAIVVARWNSFVVESLLSGALDSLKRHGVSEDQITIVRCPGAFEIPLSVKKTVLSNKFEAVIALGAVIRGGTPHFDFIANECTKGLAEVNLTHETPVSFGILTVDNIEQAIERSGTKAGNKGADAALAAIEMVSLIEKLEGL